MYKSKLVRREEITVGYKCNIKCRFCFYGCSPQDSLRKLGDIQKDLLLCKRAGIEHIELSGGEPTLHPEIQDIISFCQEQGFKTICMITNGVLFKNKVLMQECQSKGLNQLVFSLHGSDDKTHNFLTRADTFQHIMSAISNAHSLGIDFRINVVVSKHNYHQLDDVADLALKLKPIMINYLIFSPLGFSEKFAKDMISSYADLAPAIAKAVDRVKNHLKVRIRYMPFCLMPDYKEYICNVHQLHYDPYEWDYVVREEIHNGLFYKWAKIGFGLFFVPLHRILTQCLNESFHEAIIKSACFVNSYKPSKCQACCYYYICDGVWKSYRSLHGVEELSPIPGRKIFAPGALLQGGIA